MFPKSLFRQILITRAPTMILVLVVIVKDNNDTNDTIVDVINSVITVYLLKMVIKHTYSDNNYPFSSFKHY